MTASPPGIARERDLPDLARSLHAAGPVVLLTDQGVESSGILAAFAKRFDHDGPVVVVEPGEPTIASVDSAASRVRELAPASVVAVGGGSVIDTAKLVAASLESPESIGARLGAGRSFMRGVRLVAVPTTAGSGSEMTRTAVVSDADGAKRWAWGDALRPDDAILLPELTVTAPPSLTTASGVDAFVHAVEAATAFGGVDTHDALEAVELIVDALPRVSAEPGDVGARTDMQMGAALAGRAIDANGTGVAHAIGHALATVHDVPHGFAVGLGLQATIRWSITAAGPRYRKVAAALAAASVADIPGRIAALFATAGFRELAISWVPATVDEAALARAIAADDNRPMCVNNARPARPEDAAYLAQLTATAWRDLQAS